MLNLAAEAADRARIGCVRKEVVEWRGETKKLGEERKAVRKSNSGRKYS
jgi:hypothetical protein